jgi:hypothetical protein
VFECIAAIPTLSSGMCQASHLRLTGDNVIVTFALILLLLNR